MGLDTLQNGISNISGRTVVTGAIIGGATAAAVGGVALGAALAKKRNKTSKRKRSKIKHTRRGWKLDRKRFNKSQKWEVNYRKRKRKHSSRIHYARKTGQPYIILRNGRAKFIKGKRRYKK